MKLVKVAAGCLNQTPLGWNTNKNNILVAIRQAREQGATLLCLPELCITGYGCEDMFLSPSVLGTASAVLGEMPSTCELRPEATRKRCRMESGSWKV